jgi:hypothetical protein
MEVRSRAYLAGALLPGQRATSIKLALLASVCAPALFGAISLAASSPAVAACTGPGDTNLNGGDAADQVRHRGSDHSPRSPAAALVRYQLCQQGAR